VETTFSELLEEQLPAERAILHLAQNDPAILP
jgi:hypothetical protein